MEMPQENERGVPESEKKAEEAMTSNQETEKAAMIRGGNEGSGIELALELEPPPTEATTTTTKPLKFDGIFAVPATPPNRAAGLTTKSASSSRSSSLKKKRRGSRGNANANGTGTGTGTGNGSGAATTASATGGGQLNFGTASVGNDLMKQSQSMTSLQASNEEQQERRDVIQAKLHLERPYNSLKKNSQSSNKMHRYSWGSGNSQCSSTSLHSSATLGLGSSGKDDLWAAIQTNYNYIMDTNLLDTCKEARCEIEGAATVLEKSSECCMKMLDETQRPEGLCEDPKELRRWLRDMESKLESSPTITELTLFGIAELQRHLAVHSVLYHEIVSHARVVSSCIRAAEKEQQLQLQQQQQQLLSSQQPASLTSNCSSESTSESAATKSSSLSSGFASDPVTTPISAPQAAAAAAAAPSKKGEGNLERLRDRYHLLYLKAFELQLCLDNLLRKRSSAANGLDDDEEEEEDDTEDDSFGYEGEATEDDLNEVNSDLDLENLQVEAKSELILQRCQIAATHIVCGRDESQATSQLLSQAEESESLSADQPRDCLAPQKPGDEADEELEEEDEEDADLLGTDVVDFLIAKRSWRHHPLHHQASPSAAATLTDFEADSESSDFEQVQQLSSRRGLPLIATSVRRVLNLEMPQNGNISNGCVGSSSSALLQPRHHNLGNKMHNKNIAVAVITPNSHTGGGHGHGHGYGGLGGGGHELNKSPLGLRKTRHHHNDTSKFNRSNRKSKNCAIFYFKHLDTDNEQGNAAGSDLQSEDDPCLIRRRGAGGGAGGDILKSADASTDDDDEGWLYTATAAAATATATATAATLEVATATSATGTAAAGISIVDGLQSTAISSTTVTTVTTDDSDKENKESGGVTTTTITNSNYDSSSACSSSNSNSNSNGRHTETSATSRVTQLQMQIHSQMEAEMEFQINGNGNGDGDGSHSHANSTRHIISNNKQQQQQNNNEGEAGEDLGVDETTVDMANGNLSKLQQMNNSFYSRADICNISVWPAETVTSCHLPPRSPAKSAKSAKSQASSSNATMSASMMLASPAKGKVSHDSIKQLVLEAEHLVRDAQEAALKTPTKQKHSIIKISSTVKKREVTMPHPIKQRVEEWLEHQPSTPQLLTRSHTHELLPGSKPDDCEASGEASETDSVPQTGGTGGAAGGAAGSDTSEGFTDSIATCMQTSTNSYGNSTERIGGSAEPIGQPATPLGFGSSNQSLNVKIVKRPQTRRKSERPWSVSCLSQLTTDAAQLTTARIVENSPPGLASHSISESALDSLSPGPRPRAASSSGTGSNAARKADSKGSLRRRKARKKRISAASAGRKSDSGSELGGDLTQTLMKSCESMSSQQLQEFTNALLSIQKGAAIAPLSPKGELAAVTILAEGEAGESQLMLPKFRVGSFTTAGLLASETRLGALAALSNYMNEDEQQAELSTEDHHSSISETAWDNYQEKYNSENYSEGFDSDAARRLLEFGDDYRNFIDSQSDCCSSLSAANNLDSFSPPRMDSLQKQEVKPLHINQDTISSSVDHARRQRALELQYERRRKTLEVRRKSCQDMDECSMANKPKEEQPQQLQTQPSLSASATALMTTPKNQSTQHLGQRTESVGRKLEFGGMSHSAQSLLRRTSESDTSTRRRRTVTADERRRSSRNLEKCIKLIPATTSSSSGSDSEDGEQEMRSLLQQSRDRLDDTRALKIRCHLLRPEDYNEIINTCRDNIRCLEAVLRGPPGTVLSNHCAGQTKGEFQPPPPPPRKPSASSVASGLRRRRRQRPEIELHLAATPVEAGDPLQLQVAECQCAPITRFLARVIEFVLDVGNMLEHFALYRFLAGTLRSLYELVNRPVGGRLERFFGGLRGLL